jgi:xylulokinase
MFIGIDTGTSAVKIVLVDRAQHVVEAAEELLAPKQPQPLWSEDDPDAWWSATVRALDRMAQQCQRHFAQVEAIGLSGQMHGTVLLDKCDKPVRPAMLWNDGRAVSEAAILAALDAGLQDEVGVLAMPGFTGPKIAWLTKHEPDVLRRTRHLLLPKDYLRLKLTGEHATDVTDAAGTWFFDQAKRTWSLRALDACSVDLAWLPPVLESIAVSGQLRPELARRWGMKKHVLVAGGAGDVAAGGIGIGAVEPGQAFISLGTSAQVFVASEHHAPDSQRMVHAFCHAAPQRWFRMAALLNGASPLMAVASWTGRSDVGDLLDAVETRYRGPSSLLALPYLHGERTPHNNPLARGAIIGLTASMLATDIVQAVLECVAFSLADCLAVLDLPTSSCSALGFIGGGARSAFWGKIIASVLGISLLQYEGANRGPAFGAARLARLCVTGETFGDIVTRPAVQSTIEPDERLCRLYEPRKEAFRSLYRALCPIFPFTVSS